MRKKEKVASAPPHKTVKPQINLQQNPYQMKV
jgi:hypothetical protein